MKRKKWLIFFALTLLVIFVFSDLASYKVVLNDDLSVPLFADATIGDFVKEITGGEITNGSDAVDTSTVGSKEANLKIVDRFKQNKEYHFVVNVVDKEAPVITADNITIYVGDSTDIASKVVVADNSKEKIAPTISGEYDINTPGTYTLKATAKDSSGNENSKEFKLSVIKKVTSAKPYYIKINRSQNVVMVYGLDNNDEYTVLVKTFLCSTGTDTPIGVFKTSDKYKWLSLYGGVFGQYTTRIDGAIWFHSVPYFSKSKDDLEWKEYNKLGTKASLGCIRLTVADVKWLYDNCPSGTSVKIYDDDNEKINKPTTIQLKETDVNKGWDPTDPDPENPWNK